MHGRCWPCYRDSWFLILVIVLNIPTNSWSVTRINAMQENENKRMNMTKIAMTFCNDYNMQKYRVRNL